MANGNNAPIEAIAIVPALATNVFVQDLGFGLSRMVWTAPHPVQDGAQETHIAAYIVCPRECLIAMSKVLANAAREVELTLVPKSGQDSF